MSRINKRIRQYRGLVLKTLLYPVLFGCLTLFNAYSQDLEQHELEQALKYVLRPDPAGLKPFQLIDQDNKPFGLDQLKGKWTFMYFGYTSCPDVCPMTTDELKIVANKLAAESGYRKNTQFVFVSVDPQRDTAESLKNFTGYFDFNLAGVVAPVKALRELTDQLGVFHRRLIVQDRETGRREYAVEHDADIYLIDPQTRPVAKFSPPHYGKEIEQLYVKIRRKAQTPGGI